MQALKKVVEINDYQKNVFEAIQSFLNSVGIESAHTRISYETSIRDFFMRTRNKKIELKKNISL